VAEDHGEARGRCATLNLVQLGVTDAADPDPDQDFAGGRFGDRQLCWLQGTALSRQIVNPGKEHRFHRTVLRPSRPYAVIPS
jgi:hypothetical protein